MEYVFSFDTARKAKASETIPPKKLKMEIEAGADSDDDDEAVNVQGNGKCKLSAVIDSDSDSDYENDENESDNCQTIDEKPSRKKTNGTTAVKKKFKTDPSDTKMSLEKKLKANSKQSRLSDVKENDGADILDTPVIWRHQTLDFLYPTKIMDVQKRRPDHKDYDGSTLYVPVTYLGSVTPVSV